jgi:hypothetical protein
MIFLGGIVCAEGILRRGQKKGEARSGNYGQAFRRTHDAKVPGPYRVVRGAGARFVAPLDRIADTLFAVRLADRHARAQRRLFPPRKIML